MEVDVEQQAFVGPELKRQERSSLAAISGSPNSNLSRLAGDERFLIPPAAIRPTPHRICPWELTQIMNLPDISYIAAPMVNQSDLPFRILVRRYGASLVYTQMPSRSRHTSAPSSLRLASWLGRPSFGSLAADRAPEGYSDVMNSQFGGLSAPSAISKGKHK